MKKKLLDFSNIEPEYYKDFCLYFIKEPDKVNIYKSLFSNDFMFFLINSSPEKFIEYFMDDLLKLEPKTVISNCPYFITKIKHPNDALLSFYIKNDFPKDFLMQVHFSDSFLNLLCNDDEMFGKVWRYVKNFNSNFINKIIESNNRILTLLKDNRLNENLTPYQVTILKYNINLIVGIYQLSKEAQEYLENSLDVNDRSHYFYFIKKITEPEIFWNCYNKIIKIDKDHPFVEVLKKNPLWNSSANLIINIIKNNE